VSPIREVIADSPDLTAVGGLNERACDLALRWRVDLRTMILVVKSAEQFLRETGRSVWIISGWRDRQKQASLGRSGRPAAPDNLSTHRSCPATGVDVSLGPLPDGAMKITWGRIAVFNGLRWGGGGKVQTLKDPLPGVPFDWGHVDRGPRARP